jgi:hypothetical protein
MVIVTTPSSCLVEVHSGGMVHVWLNALPSRL